MKLLLISLLLAISLLILARADPGAPRAVAHVYIAYRVIPYFGEEAAARGMLVLDVNDGAGAIAVVGLPPEIIEQIISMSKKQAISYVHGY